MSDIDAVIELLERWRDATGMGRLRIGVDATRVIAQLPAERKRALAVEVAERVAPQLVPAIEAESGDLSAEQVGALVDLLRRADPEQLDDLVAALREGDIGEAAELVGEAVAVVAPPDPDTAELLDDIATPDVEEAAADELPPPPVEDEDDDEDGLTVETTAAAAAAMAGRDDIEVTADGQIELDEEAVREQLRVEARARAEQYRDSSQETSRAPAYRAPEVDFISERDDELELPDPTVESVAPLQARTGLGRLAAPPVSQTVAALTATPDGYRRRRAALQAIRDGRLATEDVAPVVRSFSRDTDRSWVAGAALDAGLVDRADLSDLGLSEPAVARLARRAR